MKTIKLIKTSDINKTYPLVLTPKYETNNSSKLDLRAYLYKDIYNFSIPNYNNVMPNSFKTYISNFNTDETFNITIYPQGRCLIYTGLHIQLPKGYEGQIRIRSELALKNGIIVTNGIGTIDADYKEDISILLSNTGNTEFIINHGDKIAQLVINKVERITFEEVIDNNKTKRNSSRHRSISSK